MPVRWEHPQEHPGSRGVGTALGCCHHGVVVPEEQAGLLGCGSLAAVVLSLGPLEQIPDYSA